MAEVATREQREELKKAANEARRAYFNLTRRGRYKHGQIQGNPEKAKRYWQAQVDLKTSELATARSQLQSIDASVAKAEAYRRQIEQATEAKAAADKAFIDAGGEIDSLIQI
jgi:ribosomal protein L29